MEYKENALSYEDYHRLRASAGWTNFSKAQAQTSQLMFVKPSFEWEQAALNYKQEHILYNETEIHGSALLDRLPYKEWLKLTEDNSDEKTVHDNWVVASTFFAVRKSDNKIIGMVDIRHSLNDFLANYGGHIGYGVRPTERQKGYAVQMLNFALKYAKSIGLTNAMLACYKDNIASRKTILKCGGKFEHEFIHTDGKTVQVFWISLDAL